jgi:predicted RNA-binding protein with TRAM domain
MVKDRYKKGSSISSRDIKRLSIYPNMPRPKDNTTKNRPRPGDTIKIEIMDVDEKERGLGKYRGYNVVVLGNATVGEVIEAKIKKVRGDTIIAEAFSYRDRDIEPF